MECKKHKTYQGVRKPRTQCRDCWNIYNSKRDLMTVEIQSEEGQWEATEFSSIKPGTVFRLINPDTNELFPGKSGKTEFKSETKPYKNVDGVLTVDVEEEED